MSWLFSKSNKASGLPAPTALQIQRSKQIEQLKLNCQNVSEIQRDVEYRVTFYVGSSYVGLYIHLPPQFPQEKPVVRVSPPVQHPWVSESMIVIGCLDITNFAVNSDLGKAIKTVIEEFTKNPPVIQLQSIYGSTSNALPYSVAPTQAPITQPPVSHPVGGVPQANPTLPMQYPPSYGANPARPPTIPAGVGRRYQPTQSLATHAAQPAAAMHPAHTQQTYTAQLAQQTQVFTHRSAIEMPEIPAYFPELQNLSEEELRKLDDDETALIEIINKLPQVEKIVSNRKELVEKTEATALMNLERKPELEEKKRALLDKYDNLNELRREFDSSCSKQDTLRGQLDPTAIQYRLKVAAHIMEEEAEEIADKFLAGSLSVDKFNVQFMEKRKLGYLRKAKEERLGHLITQMQPQQGF